VVSSCEHGVELLGWVNVQNFLKSCNDYQVLKKGSTLQSHKDFFPLVAPTLGSLLPLLEQKGECPQFLDQGQSVGLLGRAISSSQGLYLYTNTEKRTHIHKH
jgi:hypothetical protein